MQDRTKYFLNVYSYENRLSYTECEMTDSIITRTEMGHTYCSYYPDCKFVFRDLIDIFKDSIISLDGYHMKIDIDFHTVMSHVLKIAHDVYPYHRINKILNEYLLGESDSIDQSVIDEYKGHGYLYLKYHECYDVSDETISRFRKICDWFPKIHDLSFKSVYCIEKLLPIIVEFRNINYLHIKCSDIKDEHVKFLLDHYEQIQYLDLSFNGLLTEKTLYHIGDAMKNGTEISNLNLSSLQCSYDAIDQITQKSSRIVILTLDLCNIDDSEAELFARMSCLTDLSLTDNRKITPKFLEYFDLDYITIITDFYPE